EQFAGVEDIDVGVGPSDDVVGDAVEKEQQAEARIGGEAAYDGFFVVKRAGIAEEGEEADIDVAGFLDKVAGPVIEIVFDAGATHQQRDGVDNNAHGRAGRWPARTDLKYRIV